MKTINKIVLLAFLFASMTSFIAVYPTANLLYTGHSFYQEEVGFIYCSGKWECRHEVGHLMDHDMGDISKSKEFGMAVSMYLYYQFKYGERNNITDTIIGTTGMFAYSDRYRPFGEASASSPQQELYANLYANVDGDISKLSPILSGFYRNEDKYEEIYIHLLTNQYYLEFKDKQ